ncbi:lipopolysaccharide-induced tumor necrosis factor-alpha factor homolog, partial [Diprion similis]|uniref:lipopolysaccharide-induced tumor necrosis factor-alpha factor homolog n=1 Tax=Diprion similis TaxID=362088 RepID=UPI001EF997FA
FPLILPTHHLTFRTMFTCCLCNQLHTETCARLTLQTLVATGESEEHRHGGHTGNHHSPSIAYCPTCRKNVITEVKISYSKIAHITCVLCVIFGCFLGCCLLPYFSMCFVTAKHYCPECDTHLASHNSILEVLH